MKTKIILNILFTLVFSVFAGSSVAFATGLPPMPVSLGIFSISMIPLPQTSGILSATVFREVWTGEVVKGLNSLLAATFLEGIDDYTRYVSAVGDEAQAIHLVYMGVEPDVLINNTTYPIPEQVLGEEDIVITLDKFQTKRTPVTDDELYALSYDKIGHVKDSHVSAIGGAKIKKAIHSLAPSGNTVNMPVLLTTGADDGTGRKRLIWADLIRFKTELDNLMAPQENRRLVLCTDHENDLLLLDTKFKDQYFNSTSGKPYSQLGFEFYSFAANPYYNPSTKAKLSYGAVPAGTDRRASIFFNPKRSAKANGWVKMYYSEAKTDPAMQRNMMNFRHNFIIMPKREDTRGAIVSANVA